MKRESHVINVLLDAINRHLFVQPGTEYRQGSWIMSLWLENWIGPQVLNLIWGWSVLPVRIRAQGNRNLQLNWFIDVWLRLNDELQIGSSVNDHQSTKLYMKEYSRRHHRRCLLDGSPRGSWVAMAECKSSRSTHPWWMAGSFPAWSPQDPCVPCVSFSCA